MLTFFAKLSNDFVSWNDINAALIHGNCRFSVEFYFKTII
jgi:hypothetical protein